MTAYLQRLRSGDRAMTEVHVVSPLTAGVVSFSFKDRPSHGTIMAHLMTRHGLNIGLCLILPNIIEVTPGYMEENYRSAL